VVSLVGMVPDVHVAPPSVERAATPWPTATHVDALAQSTAFRSGSLASNAPCFHVVPPFCEVDATPLRPPSPPTATHSVAVGHDTALKLPLPLAAPPAVGTAGAVVSSRGTIQRLIDVEPDVVDDTATGDDVVSAFTAPTVTTEIVPIDTKVPSATSVVASARRAP
jgi:hypothetical protein